MPVCSNRLRRRPGSASVSPDTLSTEPTTGANRPNTPRARSSTIRGIWGMFSADFRRRRDHEITPTPYHQTSKKTVALNPFSRILEKQNFAPKGVPPQPTVAPRHRRGGSLKAGQSQPAAFLPCVTALLPSYCRLPQVGAGHESTSIICLLLVAAALAGCAGPERGQGKTGTAIIAGSPSLAARADGTEGGTTNTAVPVSPGELGSETSGFGKVVVCAACLHTAFLPHCRPTGVQASCTPHELANHYGYDYTGDGVPEPATLALPALGGRLSPRRKRW